MDSVQKLVQSSEVSLLKSEQSDYTVQLADKLVKSYPTVPREIAEKVAEIAPKAGHNDWLESSRGSYLPHPTKNQEIVVNGGEIKKGRSGYMKFETILEVRKALVSHSEILRTGFKSRLVRDLDVSPETLGYIDEMDGDQFRKWMVAIAFENVSDNSGWANSAIELMVSKDMLSPDVDKVELAEKVKKLYKTTEALQHPINRLETAADYRELFRSSTLLEDSMVLAHGHWRERLADKLKNKVISPVNPTEAVATLKTIINTDVKFISIGMIEDFVGDLRERVHLNPSNPTHAQTFNLMLELADVLDKKLEKVDPSTEFSTKMKGVRNGLLGQLSYDANVAIPLAINEALGLNINFVSPEEL